MSWQVDIRIRLGELDLDVDMGGDITPIALIGPNGSGKTTLLRTIAGAYRADSGQIRLGEGIVFDAEQDIDLPPEERQVGYVPQGYGLFPHLNALDNVAFSWRSKRPRIPPAERRKAAAELLEQMGCVHLASRMPSALSGGEKQRVSLGRALMINPQILLLDEPLSALDVSARRSLRSYLAGYLAERAGPTLVVTHDPRDVLALKAHVYVVEAGRIVQHGSIETLSAQPATDFVAEFFDLSGN